MVTQSFGRGLSFIRGVILTNLFDWHGRMSAWRFLFWDGLTGAIWGGRYISAYC